MRGRIIGFDSRTGTGALEGEDGNRYEFAGTEWRSDSHPAAGFQVDFSPDGHLAVAIFPVYDPADVSGDFSWRRFFLSFSGRTNRKPYWLYYVLPVTVISLLLIPVDMVLGTYSGDGNVGLLGSLFSLVCLWPTFAIGARRCHDRGRSGWFQLIILIPLIGAIWLLVELGFLRGTHGPNRFGPDPLGGRS